jgi:hypothetical protein
MKSKKSLDYLSVTTELTKIIARDDELFLQFRKALGLTSKQFASYLNCVDTAQCRTVAVAELLDNRLLGVTTFPDTFEGNCNAENLFKRLYNEHNDPDGTTDFVQPSNEEWKAMLLDGTYDDETGYKLIITQSNP